MYYYCINCATGLLIIVIVQGLKWKTEQKLTGHCSVLILKLVFANFCKFRGDTRLSSWTAFVDLVFSLVFNHLIKKYVRFECTKSTFFYLCEKNRIKNVLLLLILISFWIKIVINTKEKWYIFYKHVNLFTLILLQI